MKRETIIWTVLILLGAVGVALNVMSRDGVGQAWVKTETKRYLKVDGDDGAEWINLNEAEAFDIVLPADPPADAYREWTVVRDVSYDLDRVPEADRAAYEYSPVQTLGLWLGALFTLAILSFLYKDNPFYKVAESVVVGVTAAYWMVIGFWQTLVPNLLVKLAPGPVTAWALPGVDPAFSWETFLLYLIPLTLSVMLLMRLSPVAGWISRWPMAFIIGVFCGIRLIGFLHADFLAQIKTSIEPIIVMSQDQGFDFWQSLKNLLKVIGVLTCLVYFFFSIEHKGVVGKTARVGIWFLMITFGAAFGYTVMGRIALLSIRLEFLFTDWLHLTKLTG